MIFDILAEVVEHGLSVCSVILHGLQQNIYTELGPRMDQ